MYKHILIATDGTELAQKAVTEGLGLAKILGAKATAVTVTEPWAAVATGEMALGFPRDQYDKGAAENAADILTTVSEVAKAMGMDCATIHAKDQYPAEGIIAAAKEKGCDLIVMASHGRRGIAKLLIGSEAIRVLTLSTVPVLICR
ncbi:MAG: universal stress protein [Hyphomicrobiaceae bacterium]|nr:MAG: universal stress protein [Hyphomicrobiaceae bacterium]